MAFNNIQDTLISAMTTIAEGVASKNQGDTSVYVLVTDKNNQTNTYTVYYNGIMYDNIQCVGGSLNIGDKALMTIMANNKKILYGNVNIDQTPVKSSSSSAVVFDFIDAVTNLNTITTAGVYIVKAANTSLGRPANYSGIMIVKVNGATIIQYYYYGYSNDYSPTTIYIYKRASANSGVSWENWSFK